MHRAFVGVLLLQAGDSLKTRMKRAFKVLDADRDGKISKVELADMFGALGADKVRHSGTLGTAGCGP